MKTIDDLAVALVQAKQKEQEAIAARHSAEQSLLALIESKTEGTASVVGTRFKATATFGFNRTVDQAMVNSMAKEPTLRWAIERLFPAKYTLDTKELRYFTANEPQLYATLASGITAKPAKPAIKVEMIAVEEKAAA